MDKIEFVLITDITRFIFQTRSQAANEWSFFRKKLIAKIPT